MIQEPNLDWWKALLLFTGVAVFLWLIVSFALDLWPFGPFFPWTTYETMLEDRTPPRYSPLGPQKD